MSSGFRSGAAGSWDGFRRDTGGGMSVLMVFLIPAFVLIFAAALDLSKLNAQRKYVQTQADLSALSAVQRLPRAPDSHLVADNVIDRNPFYGPIAVETRDVEFGNFHPGVGLVRGPDQNATLGVDAVGVTVASRYRPILLAKFFADDDLWVVRRAVAARRDVASFTLRNALLRVNTDDSILQEVLGDQLHLDTAVLSYEGLATTYVSARQLMGIVEAEADADLLTFAQALDADVSYAGFLSGLVGAALLPAAALQGSPAGTFRLGDLLNVSPQAAQLTYDRALPDIHVALFDLLSAMANLSGQGTHHLITAAAGLTAAPLADAAVGLELVDPGVTVFGLANVPDPLHAEVAQIRAVASGSLAGLVDLDLELRTAVAEAWLVSLDCQARDPADVVARLRVDTAPATLAVHVGLLAGTGGATSDPITVAGNTSYVDITVADIGQPIAVDNPIAVSQVVSALSDTIDVLGDDLAASEPILVSLLAPVTTAVSPLIDDLNGLIADEPALDGAAQALLDLLGAKVAQAEVIFHGFGCSSAMVQ